eukprot:TRINITY_DN3559_c0_g1_i4.p1 TRINITY_DN3559_c0_g1~~TRINITY_DN3559_c0_g1_i4.p1  ORF type:complete len:558 (-),score=56.97 TRINITY_DN3559_c0_g1_i4:73-1746(-)
MKVKRIKIESFDSSEVIGLFLYSQNIVLVEKRHLYYFDYRGKFEISIDAPWIGNHLEKNEDLLVSVGGGVVSVFEVGSRSLIFEGASKDGTFFLNGFATRRKRSSVVVGTTSNSIYIWNNFDSDKLMVVSTSTPVSRIVIKGKYLICGFCDGSLSVYNTYHGNKLYNINHVEKRSESFLQYRSELITCILLIDEFIIASSKDGKCGLFHSEQRYSSNGGLVNFQLPENHNVFSINKGKENRIQLYFKDSENNIYVRDWKFNKPKLMSSFYHHSLVKMVNKSTEGIFHDLKIPEAADLPVSSPQNCRSGFLVEVEKRALKQYPFLQNISNSCTITDATQHDNPIAWVNDDFVKMTGYEREEIIGVNCRFLQGKYSNPDSVKQISQALSKGEFVCTELLNYRKDGTPFWNTFCIYPVCNKKNQVFAFLAIQKEAQMIDIKDNLKKFLYRKPYEYWKPEEVGLWIDSIPELASYGHVFVNKNISGDQLHDLNMEESSSTEDGSSDLVDVGTMGIPPSDWRIFRLNLARLTKMSNKILRATIRSTSLSSHNTPTQLTNMED